MATPDDEAEAERGYGDAEEAFLEAIRTLRDRSVLSDLADDVAARAKVWNAEAYKALHAAQGEQRTRLDLLTERTEVLENLWFDIAGAFHGRRAARDG